MGSSLYVGQPGIAAQDTASHRHVFLQQSEKFLAQGRIINGSASRDPGNTGDIGVLRPGLLMGKITATGFYAPAYVGVLQAAYTSGGTEITVSVAQAVELLRLVGASGTAELVAIGPPTANGTLAETDVSHSAIDTATGVLTVTDLGASKVAGTLIAVKDGRQTPLTFIPDWDYGVKVTDQDGDSVAVVDFPKFPMWGVIDSSQLLPVWPSDTSIQAEIVTSLGSANQHFSFDHLV